ncbi:MULTISPECIES: hypothetical protein [unclassified Streptomyces]|uniref:hypothetical protein n=1 Tax=unclassified Streptomyces TaxID=2593676 RepID=UPI0005ECDEDF|nr:MULTISPECIES: hypothetical protein [unclassified Streptomyces]APU41969.1 hypothetical protein BSL84_21505 [Streptomyces sp. TN58]KJK51995.1 hypothetical protein UK14_10090 [Streptomyces sp. NRRL F-4428]
MAEQQTYGRTHCGPCEECVEEEWQLVREDGELGWEGYQHCPRYEVYACDRGRGIPPPWVRERVLAREGAVHLAVGGPDGIPIALLRRVYGLSIAEVLAARTAGYRATPVEARYLTAAARAAAPTSATATYAATATATATTAGGGPAGPG